MTEQREPEELFDAPPPATEDAVRWINEQGEQPWFLWFSFINPHTPVHLPPRELLTSEARDLDPNLTGDDN